MVSPKLLSICFLSFLFCLNACDFQFHDVRIELQLTDTTQIDLPVYITGNDITLGSWEPDKVRMKGGPELYYLDLKAPTTLELEYKFTRGSWDTEALGEDGKVQGNYSLIVNSDTSVRHAVNTWKTADYVLEGSIVGERIELKIPTNTILKDRKVWIWLPPGYEEGADKKYPLLLTHDGQNVFEPSSSLSGEEWRLDEMADSLIRAGTLEPFIIVAVSNTADRSEEYSYGEEADLYARYLIGEVLPYVYERFPLAQGAENTAVMGSSMGGLSSFVLAWEHPDVFGKAACLSPAFQHQDFDYVAKAAEQVLPTPMPAFYLDNGTLDLEERLQPGIDAMKVFLDSREIAYEWYLDVGAAHSEGAWANRIDIPLKWMFGTKQ